ncbi:MAG: M48 family metalloprotease [Candidatus Firestonebacteria bacterium]
MNYFKTFVLMFALTLLLMGIGRFIGGVNGMTFALLFAFVMNFGVYWFSDKIILKMYGAKEANEAEYSTYFKTVRNLTTKADLPMPKLYVLKMPVPNAFATGRNPEHSAVAVSPSLLEMLTKDEIEAVLAHELSHIKNRDILIATSAAAIAGAISHLAYMAQWAAMFGGMGGNRDNDRGGSNPIVFLALAILAPLAAVVVQLAISRSREYSADESAARLTERPQSLINALQKISEGAKKNPILNTTPSTASLFIVNPMKESFFVNLFSTHPTLGRRIASLEKISENLISGR